jgi:Leucine-rich repeat (LRR) protein
LAQLLPLQKIQVLSVAKCQLSDKGVENIAKLKALSNLSLAGNTKVTNDSISSLQKLPLLYSLDLDQTSVDSRAIPDLAKMKNLRLLVVNFSNADLAKLKQAMPHCISSVAVKRAITPEFFAPLK